MKYLLVLILSAAFIVPHYTQSTIQSRGINLRKIINFIAENLKIISICEPGFRAQFNGDYVLCLAVNASKNENSELSSDIKNLTSVARDCPSVGCPVNPICNPGFKLLVYGSNCCCVKKDLAKDSVSVTTKATKNATSVARDCPSVGCPVNPICNPGFKLLVYESNCCCVKKDLAKDSVSVTTKATSATKNANSVARDCPSVGCPVNPICNPGFKLLVYGSNCCCVKKDLAKDSVSVTTKATSATKNATSVARDCPSVGCPVNPICNPGFKLLVYGSNCCCVKKDLAKDSISVTTKATKNATSVARDCPSVGCPVNPICNPGFKLLVYGSNCCCVKKDLAKDSVSVTTKATSATKNATSVARDCPSVGCPVNPICNPGFKLLVYGSNCCCVKKDLAKDSISVTTKATKNATSVARDCPSVGCPVNPICNPGFKLLVYGSNCCCVKKDLANDSVSVTTKATSSTKNATS